MSGERKNVLRRVIEASERLDLALGVGCTLVVLSGAVFFFVLYLVKA